MGSSDSLTFEIPKAIEFIKKPADGRARILEALWKGASKRHGGKPFPEEWKEGGANWSLVETAGEVDDERAATQFLSLLAESATRSCRGNGPAGRRLGTERKREV